MKTIVFNTDNNEIEIKLDSVLSLVDTYTLDKQRAYFEETYSLYENVFATQISRLGKLILFNDETYLWLPYSTNEEIPGFYKVI